MRERSVARLPVFVKPARAGSSIGISKVQRPGRPRRSVEQAFEHDPKVLVEAAVERAGESSAACSRGSTVVPMPAWPPRSGYGGHECYDFEAKYLDEEGVTFDVPADLQPDTRDEVRRLAVAAFEALDCDGLARVDFFLQRDGRLIVNEVNTMPGFTPISMYPRMWARVGRRLPELVDRLADVGPPRSTGLR